MTSLLSLSLFAQRDLATLVGTVSDPAGAAVPNAKITISEDSTGLKYEVTSGNGGEYARPALKPGVYTITAEAQGFKRSVRKNIVLTAGDRIGADIQLSVGEVTTTVEVSAETPLLQTESTTLGINVSSKSVSELPLGGQRNAIYLARLSPGVVPAEPGARDATGGGFSANGVRSNGQNNFLLNGVDNNVNVIDFLNQTAYVIGPSPDAIGEMRIATNGYGAEYGRGAGGVVNVTIKSGTNSLHGSAYNFLQNDKLNANRWENNANGVSRGPFKQNQFGATLGGPLIKNRTFWFADYQETQIRSLGGSVPGLGTSSTFTIPTAAMKLGDFSNAGSPIYDPATQIAAPGGALTRSPFPGNRIPSNRFDPAAQKIMALFPEPNRIVPAGFPQDNYFVTTSGQQTVRQGDLRMDHKISDKDSLFGSLSWSNNDQFNGQPLPGALDATYFASNAGTAYGRNAMLSYTRVWTPSILTETRGAFTRLITTRTQANPSVDQFTAFGIGGFNPSSSTNGGLPSTSVDRYSGFGASDWLPSIEYSNVLNFIQNLSVTKGAHSIKVGAEYRQVKFPFFQVPSPHGNWSFNRFDTGQVGQQTTTGDGMASFLLGRVNNAQISTGNFISSQRTSWAFFAQDDWKITSKLTLNYGIRYEIFQPIDERFGRQSNFDLDTLTLFIPKGKDQNAPLPPNFATAFPNVRVSRGEVNSKLIATDYTNIGPRLGLAYSYDPKTVVRAGYGMFYGGEENQGGFPNRGEAVPFNATVQLNRANNFLPNQFFTTTERQVSAGFPINVFSLPAPVSFRSIATNFRTPLVHKWNFSIQREFARGNVFELAYVGNHSARQVQNPDPNAPFNNASNLALPGDLRRPFPNIGGIAQTASFGFGRYAGLTAKWEKRFSEGLTYTASYTYGHALATSGTTLSGSPGLGSKDPRNLSLAYSSASWDIRHNFVGNFLYELPFGKGKKFMSGMSSVGNTLIGGWQINGLISIRTGAPFTLGTNDCIGAWGNCTPDVLSGKDPKNAPSGGRTAAQWFDTSAVVRPARSAPNATTGEIIGTNGTLGLQSNNLPGQQVVDLGLFKSFRLTERFGLQFRSEAFNLLNTVQFAGPNRIQGDPNFGRITGSQGGTERKFQLSLRVSF